MAERFIGALTHYFGKPGVAALTLTDGPVATGDEIHVKGATSDFTQIVESMQTDHENVESAAIGDQVGIKVGQRARVHDKVYVVTAD